MVTVSMLIGRPQGLCIPRVYTYMRQTMQTPDLDRVTIETRADFEEAAKADPFNSLWELADGVELTDIFNIEVVEAEETLSWGESYIGTSLGSCQDYGRHWDLSDPELIEKAFDGLNSQFLGFMGPENEELAETVFIVRKENGYVKTAAPDFPEN